MSPAALASLPQLASDYALAPQLAEAFRRDGHVVTRGVCTADEIAAYRPLIQAAVAKFNKQTKPLAERDTYHKAFLQIANLWEIDEGVKRYVLARRFAKIAADLMGVKGVRIWHDQALFKEPGGGPTPWHQDQYYWPLKTANTITMWMPLVDAPRTMGTVKFATGTHRKGPLASMHISDESEQFFQNYVRDSGCDVGQYDLSAGDATWHYGWTLHAAPGNESDKMREAMTVIYFEDGAKVAEPANQHQPADLARWLTGLKPGDVAASPLNPLVYPA
jgi:ectoine hydroxylase-related dioxygenase (phytanoyl-CoA dioxygenase family)